MRKSPWSGLLIAAAAATSLSASAGKSKTEYKIYKAKDGSRVVIANKLKEEATPESVVRFHSPENHRTCSLDFSSEDGEHGFGVVKAAWTPDEGYFVFSLTSSGGHQTWQSPTVFFGLRDMMIRSLDSYTERPISTGDFRLQAPNTVLTAVSLRESYTSVKFHLDSLTSDTQRERNVLPCADAAVYRVEPSDLRNHD